MTEEGVISFVQGGWMMKTVNSVTSTPIMALNHTDTQHITLVAHRHHPAP